MIQPAWTTNPDSPITVARQRILWRYQQRHRCWQKQWTECKTTSGAVTERPCIASCLFVVRYLEHCLLLLVSSTSDLPIKFCSVVFCLAYSSMIDKIHWCVVVCVVNARSTVSCLSHSNSHPSDSQIFIKNRDFCSPYLHLMPPLAGPIAVLL